MFIIKLPSGDDYNVYLVESYRDDKGNVQQRILRKFGLLSDLVKKNPNAYKELQDKYKNLQKREKRFVTIPLNQEIKNDKDIVNYGYFFIEAIYNGLGINKVIKSYVTSKNLQYDLNAIVKMLVFSLVLGSLEYTEVHASNHEEIIENQDRFFNRFNNKLNDTYQGLSVLKNLKDDILVAIHRAIKKNFGRDLSVILYDLKNYYFETKKGDELKETRNSSALRYYPIIQIGLLIDKNKLPISYELSLSNNRTSRTLHPLIQKAQANFGIAKTSLVVKKGLNKNEDFAKIISQGHSYIVRHKVRGASQDFINEVLDDKGYKQYKKLFKYKEMHRQRIVKQDQKKLTIKEKVIVYSSRDFDGKLDYERKDALEGYNAILTSDIARPGLDIIKDYRQFQKIRGYFSAIKPNCEDEFVFLESQSHMEGHFLVCFIALTILRILEKKLDYKYIDKHIKDALAKAICMQISQDYFSFQPKREIIKIFQALADAFIMTSIADHKEIKQYKKTIMKNFFKG